VKPPRCVKDMLQALIRLLSAECDKSTGKRGGPISRHCASAAKSMISQKCAARKRWALVNSSSAQPHDVWRRACAPVEKGNLAAQSSERGCSGGTLISCALLAHPPIQIAQARSGVDVAQAAVGSVLTPAAAQIARSVSTIVSV
jgi:hypothetical protein